MRSSSFAARIVFRWIRANFEGRRCQFEKDKLSVERGIKTVNTTHIPNVNKRNIPDTLKRLDAAGIIADMTERSAKNSASLRGR